MIIDEVIIYDWLMNWIKRIYRGGDKKLVSNNQTIIVSLVMAKLYKNKQLAHGLNIITYEYLVK